MIETRYKQCCETNSDINQHLPTLYQISKECDSIIELGVRAIVSTYAFLIARPKSLLSVDIVHPEEYEESSNTKIEEIEKWSKENNVDFQLKIANTLKIELPEVDFIFIDTQHNYRHLISELNIHGNKAKKYLAFHDTTLFGYHDNFAYDKLQEEGQYGKYAESLLQGLNAAIFEFQQHNPHWKVHQIYTNNNGLTILKRDDV